MDLTRGVGPCRKRARASTWLAQLRPKLPQKLQEVQNLQRLLQTMKLAKDYTSEVSRSSSIDDKDAVVELRVC